MNEIDLKLKIEGLEKVIQEHKADANRYEDQLKETQKQLEDFRKLNSNYLQSLYGDLLNDITDFQIIERIESTEFGFKTSYKVINYNLNQNS